MTSTDDPPIAGIAIVGPPEADGRPIDKIAAALAKAQPRFTSAAKNRKGAEKRNRDTGEVNRLMYADLDEVRKACVGPMGENGLSIVQIPSVDERGKIWLSTLLMHESGQWLRSVYPVNPGGQDAQSVGSAMTYARRYSWTAILGITSDEDDDGQAAVHSRPPNDPGFTKADPRPAERRRPTNQQSRPQSVPTRTVEYDDPPFLPTREEEEPQLEEVRAAKPAPGKEAPLARYRRLLAEAQNRGLAAAIAQAAKAELPPDIYEGFRAEVVQRLKALQLPPPQSGVLEGEAT